MSDNEDFFQERRAQAVFKHGILSRYPTVFAAKTGVAGERHVRAAVKALHAAGEITNTEVTDTRVGKYFFRELIRPVN